MDHKNIMIGTNKVCGLQDREGTAKSWPTVLLVCLRMREMGVGVVQLGVDWKAEGEDEKDVATDVLS